MEEENFNQRKEKGDIKGIKAESGNKTESRQEKWERISNEIKKTADALGYEIDKNIKDAVIALNAHDINTIASCEGHAEKRQFSAPWVKIAAPDEPEERFNGQNKAFENVAKKYNLPIEEVKRMTPEDAYWEARHEFEKNEETKEYIDWKEKSRKLMEVVEKMLNDFYQERKLSENLRIQIENNIDDVGEGNFRIYSGGKDYQIIEKDLEGKEKKELEERMGLYRNETNLFAEFLKDKFFKEGADYVDGIVSKIQNKIDQDKIKRVKENLENNSL